MRIAEIYQSRQGEGRLTGTESVFVRTSGCNLRCWFCDTPHTSWDPEGHDLSVDEIVEQVTALPCPHVVVTGGEPMLFAELIPLTKRLSQAGRHITIETAGTLYLPVEADLMSISPKFGSSAPNGETHANWRRRHERTRHQPDVIRQLIGQFDYQIKFVIHSMADCKEADRYLDDFPELSRASVYLMPQGVAPEELASVQAWLEPYCHQKELQYCPRRQIEWFGPVRGT